MIFNLSNFNLISNFISSRTIRPIGEVSFKHKYHSNINIINDKYILKDVLDDIYL